MFLQTRAYRSKHDSTCNMACARESAMEKNRQKLYNNSFIQKKTTLNKISEYEKEREKRKNVIKEIAFENERLH